MTPLSLNGRLDEHWCLHETCSYSASVEIQTCSSGRQYLPPNRMCRHRHAFLGATLSGHEDFDKLVAGNRIPVAAFGHNYLCPSKGQFHALAYFKPRIVLVTSFASLIDNGSALGDKARFER
jgi:hypothetical protein